MTLCHKCCSAPTLRASIPRLCWACAKQLHICIYCGDELDPDNSLGVCPFCDPPWSGGAGNRTRGWELADLQYHGSYRD